MKTEIVPSIIASNQKELDKIFDKISFASTVHLDVMDGVYVPNKSLWFDLKLKNHNYEAHLMIKNPETFIARHHSEIKTFAVHAETVQNLDALIDFVHSVRCRIYLALKPNIPVSRIKRYLRKIDGVFIMTVNPGKYGAAFIRSMVGKIRQARNMFRKDIEIDGGMNPETIKLCKNAGANRFVVGSYLQKQKDLKKEYNILSDI